MLESVQSGPAISVAHFDELAHVEGKPGLRSDPDWAVGWASVVSFPCCLGRVVSSDSGRSGLGGVAQRLVHLALAQQREEHHGQLARRRDHSAFLGRFAAASSDLLAEAT